MVREGVFGNFPFQVKLSVIIKHLITYQDMARKLKETQQLFLQKEKRRTLIFFSVMLFVKFAPPLFSYSGTSSMYEVYYASQVPFSLPDLLMMLYVVRLVILGYWHFIRKPKQKLTRPQEVFSDGY